LDIREVERDLKKVARSKTLFAVSGFFLFVLAVVLLVLFVTSRELSSILLCIASFIFGALLLNQALRSRELEDMIEKRLCYLKGLEEERKDENQDSSNLDEDAPGGCPD